MEEVDEANSSKKLNKKKVNDSTTNTIENDVTKNYKYILYRQESIIEDIPETHVLKAVEKKLGTKHFLLLTYKLQPLTEKLGLLGDYRILDVSYLNDEGIKKYLKFFVKFLPKYDAPAEFAVKIGAFDKEMFVYKLFKEFNKEDVYLVNNVISQCYVSAHNNYLILDELCSDGYECIDKHSNLDYDTVLIVLQALAKLHASSIIFENKVKKNLKDLYPSDFKESFYSQETNQQGTDASIKCILEEINLFDQPKVLKSGKKFVDVAEKVCYKIYDLVKPSDKYKNVLTHGDIWATNILIKHNDKTKKPISCKLVDFQCGRYVPPAQDVLSFLFLTTTREFRKQYMYEVMGMYYSYLEKNLRYVGLDINQILPFDNFMESCEELKIFGIVIAALYFPLILINNSDIHQYFSDSELNKKVLFDNRIHLVLAHMEKDNNYQKRLKESIEDLKDYCENYK